MSYVIQSRNIKAIGYEAKSTSKIEFLSCRFTFCGKVSCKKLSLVTESWMSYWRFSCLIVASNFDKWIQNPRHWINFFYSSFRFVKSDFIQWICICISLCIDIFTMDQTTFVSTTWNFHFFLSLWPSFF